MNRCEHGYNCANADCHVMFQNMALSRGAAPNLQPAQQDGKPPGYAQQQGPHPGNPQQPNPPSGYPQQYGPSQPIPIPPRPAPPSYPMNTYYPPNSYIHYAQPLAGMPRPHPEMNLPPWNGNMPPPGFPAPTTVVGPPAPMPTGGYIPGTQLPGPAWYIPYDGPYRPRGGGNDQDPQEEVKDLEDFVYDAEDDADGVNNAFRCLHCRQHCPSSKNKWSIDEDDWADRQGQAWSEEDLREAGPVLGSTDHVMFIEEPGSTDKRRSHGLKGNGARYSAGRLLAKEKKQQSLHRYFTRQKSRSQVPTSKATSAGKKRALKEDCVAANEHTGPTTLPHGHNSSKTDQTPIGQLRGGRSQDQQPPDHGFPKAKDVKSDSIPPIPSNQPRTSTRLLWLTAPGHLFHTIEHRLGDSWQRSFEPSSPTDKRFVNYVYAHEDQISRAVLKELGIPFYFSEESNHVVVKTDCNDKLLLELLERTRIKRNYAGQCMHGPVRLNSQSGRGDFVPGRLGSERARETELEIGPADAIRIRGGSGDPPDREKPTGPSTEPAPIRACLRRNRDRVAQSTSNIGLSNSTTSPPVIDLLHVYAAQKLVPSRQHGQQTTPEGHTGDPRLSGETPLTYAAALGVNLDPPEYIEPNLHAQPAQPDEILGYRRMLRESRKSRPEISHHTRPLPWHLQSNWRRNQSSRTSWVEWSDPGRGFEPNTPRARKLNLTSGFSLQCENGYSFSLDSLDQTPYPYYIHVHDTLIAPYFLRELDIPHHWHHSDYRFINITESLSRDMIHMLTLRTSLEYRTRSDLVNIEAAQRQHVGSGNARFVPEKPFREGFELPPLATHLRGGTGTPSDDESLSPLSPRRHPGETPNGYNRRRTQAIAEQRHHAHISMDDDDDEDENDTRLPSSPTTGGPAESAHERNLRRLQQSMETRSHRRDQEELERQRILDPELDSRDSSRNIRHQRRNAVDFGTPPPWVPDEEVSWVLDQEAAQNRRSISRGRTRWRPSHDFMNGPTNGYGGSPRREYGPNGDEGRPRGGNSGSSSHEYNVTYNGEDEIAPFVMQPGGQEVNLQDVAEFVVRLAPHGARLHFRREGVDFELNRFPVDGEEERRR